MSDSAKNRLAWFQYAIDRDASIKDVCDHFGISPTTFHRWAKVYDPERPLTLESLSSAPHSVREPETPQHVIDRIEWHRRAHPLAGKNAIANKLAEEGITISASTVGRVIQKEGLYFGNTASHRMKRLRLGSKNVSDAGNIVWLDRKETAQRVRNLLGGSSVLSIFLGIVITSLALFGGIQSVYALEGSTFQIHSNFPNEAMQNVANGQIFSVSRQELTNLKKPISGSTFQITNGPGTAAASSVSSAASVSSEEVRTDTTGGGGTGGGRREETLNRYQNERLHPAAKDEQQPTSPVIPSEKPQPAPEVFIPIQPEHQPKTPSYDAGKTVYYDGGAPVWDPFKGDRKALQFFEELHPSACPEIPECPEYPADTYSLSVQQHLWFWLGVVVGMILMILIGMWHDRDEKKPTSKKRKKKQRFSLFCIALLIALASQQQPQMVHAITTTPLSHVYNGHLLLGDGTAVTTAHTIRFSYWTSADFTSSDLTGTGAINTGASTYVGWYEEHTVTPNSDGAFSVELGSITPLPGLDSLPVTTLLSLHLQVEVKVSGGADSTYDLLDVNGSDDTDDRSPVLSLPFAQNADLLDQRDTGTGSGSIPVLGAGGSLTLDNGSTQSGSITLEFGKTLMRQLSYNIPNARFEFNDDVQIDGTLTISGSTIGTGTGAGTLRWTGTDFEGYNGTNWEKLNVGGGIFIGTTTVTSTGSISSGDKVGYEAANAICAAQYAGSHMCQASEIITTINRNITAFTGASNGWVAEGAPGYTSESNDCKGWTSGSGVHLGAWWEFSTDGGSNIKSGGGEGFLTSCSTVQPIACCR